MPGNVVLVSGVRTAVGKFGLGFKDVPAQRLGAIVIKEAIKRSGLQLHDIEEVIMGNVVSAGLGQNPARQAAIYAGIPYDVGSITVNKVCGSAVMLGSSSIKAGDSQIIVTGGMENMSAAPHLIKNMRWGTKFGDATISDSLLNDGLWDVYNNFHMGITGERIAEKFGITREEADEFALMSHQKALQAINNRKFDEEIVPVEVKGNIIKKDEGVRTDTSLEKLQTLTPVFKKNGILTAGNSSQLSDGAAALVLASESKAKELGIKPRARILDYTTSGTKPEDVMEAPIFAVRKLLGKTGLSIDEIDLIEHNEAYASASIAIAKELEITPEKLNVNGGAIALGHPIGCSGARILVTLLHALEERKLKRGLATLCLGGGNAVAMIIER
ncbi:MAG: acetyl-CoA C-acetyltransferase [Candidatus Methanoperedens sp.]